MNSNTDEIVNEMLHWCLYNPYPSNTPSGSPTVPNTPTHSSPPLSPTHSMVLANHQIEVGELFREQHAEYKKIGKRSINSIKSQGHFQSSGENIHENNQSNQDNLNGTSDSRSNQERNSSSRSVLERYLDSANPNPNLNPNHEFDSNIDSDHSGINPICAYLFPHIPASEHLTAYIDMSRQWSVLGMYTY